ARPRRTVDPHHRAHAIGLALPLALLERLLPPTAGLLVGPRRLPRIAALPARHHAQVERDPRPVRRKAEMDPLLRAQKTGDVDVRDQHEQRLLLEGDLARLVDGP